MRELLPDRHLYLRLTGGRKSVLLLAQGPVPREGWEPRSPHPLKMGFVVGSDASGHPHSWDAGLLPRVGTWLQRVSFAVLGFAGLSV